MRPKVRVGHQITELLESHAVATSGADRVVLNRIDTGAILDVKIGAVEQIKDLGLEDEGTLFAQAESARHTKVYLENPRTIEGVQSSGRACADSTKGVTCGLERGGVVQNDAQPVAIVKRKC